jgi:DNA-3-methyladenine glycosylase II
MKATFEKSFLVNDPVIEKLMLQLPQPTIETTNNVFHDVMSCIIEQQIHYRSSKRIFAKALERASIEYLTVDNFYLFEKLSLPQIKLSKGKYDTIINMLECWKKNKKDFTQLTDEEVKEELSQIKGIGKWTIDMILLFTLQRPNIFPYDDYHLKQIMTSLYGLNEKVKLKEQMIEIANNWNQQKSMAVLYLLAYKKHKM